MSQDVGVAPVGSDQLSVVQLSRLHERVLLLREHLRAALLADGPQLEMIVFTSLLELYEQFYLSLFVSRASSSAAAATATTDKAAGNNATSDPSAETRFVTSAYTQDLLAACLYLIDPSSLPHACTIASQPPPLEAAHTADNASSVYISAAQRQFCFSIFMYVCWSSTALPLKDVLHALYPLLDPGAADGTGAAGAGTAAPSAENSIAVELFSHPRFASRKCFIGETLSGLVFSRANGLRALLRVLLLDDRVESDMTAEAAQLVVRVLTTPPVAAWVLCMEAPPLSACSVPHEGARDGGSASVVDQRVVRITSPSVEAQIVKLAPQLLSLLEEQAEGDEADDKNDDAASRDRSTAQARKANRPRFLARLEALHQRLPAETLEQRLHVFVTQLLNTLVRLPARNSAAFPRCYRQFFYSNKYILTPGFGCLSLRGDGPFSAEDLVAALRRLTSLMKGVALGTGTAALSHVLPATAAGLLSMCALQSSHLSEQSAVAAESTKRVFDAFGRLLVPLLSDPSLFELTAHALVQACTRTHAHSFSLVNVVEPTIAYVHRACTAENLSVGLAWLLFAMPSSASDFVHVCVREIVDACQLDLYASGVDALATSSPSLKDQAPLTSSSPLSITRATAQRVAETETTQLSSLPPLVRVLERLCLEAPSAAIFGTGEQLSLPSTLTFLGRFLGLSAVLYRWAVGMLNSLLQSDSMRVALQEGGISAATSGQPSRDASVAAEEHHRFLARLVRTVQSVLSTLRMLHESSGADGSVARVSMENDPELIALTAEASAALQKCAAEATRLLNEYTVDCDAHMGDGSDRRASNEVAMAVTAQWQRLLKQVQAGLDGRSSVEVALTLSALSRSVDDVVHDVADPQLLLPVVQPLLLTLVRVLYECDEIGSAVRAVHCLTWLSMYRFDSADSAYMADIIWAVLGEETVQAWLAAHIGHPTTTNSAPAAAAKASASSARLCRLRVRLLDVLLAWTDYDDDARTLRNVDDVLRRTRHVSLFDTLVRQCRSSSDVLVQVATLHLVGAYALAVHPRVPLTALCDLCRDVFRLSSHEMAKAACAAAVGKVIATLCQSEEAGAILLTEVDLNACTSLATAMASYRGRPPSAPVLPTKPSATVDEQAIRTAEIDMHDAVIQQHGRDMLELLRQASQSLGSSSAASAPSVLQVEMPKVSLT